MASTQDDPRSGAKRNGARTALTEAAERFEQNPDETFTGTEVAARLRGQAEELR